jgi:hypothetical protein
MGATLTETSVFTANVVAPLDGDLVTGASVTVGEQALTNRTRALVDGKWSTKSGVTSVVESGGALLLDAGAALVSNGSAEFNGTGPDRTTVEDLFVGASGATFTGPLTGQVGELTWPASPGDRSFSAEENSGATVSASSAFTMIRNVSFNQSVPNGGGGVYTSTLWVTPSAPWILEGMALQITSSCSSDADPSTVHLAVYVDMLVVAIEGDMSAFAAGTTYLIDNTSSNKRIFGLASAEKGTLLTSPLSDSGKDKLGIALDDQNLTVAALSVGDTFSLWGKPLTINVTHGSGSARTLNIPMRLIVWGRLL